MCQAAVRPAFAAFNKTKWRQVAVKCLQLAEQNLLLNTELELI